MLVPLDARDCFFPYGLVLLLALALFREVLICEREKNAVLDVLVNRRTAKCYSEVLIFFLLEQSAHRRRRVILVPDFVLDELRDGVVFPNLERSSFRGESLLIPRLGNFRAIPFLGRVIGV
jgi:hypothetical protein